MRSHGDIVPARRIARKTATDRLAEFGLALAINCAPRYVRQLEAVVHRFIWACQIIRPEQITRQVLQGYIAQLVINHAPKTVRNYATSLSSFCNFLVEENCLAENPCRNLRLPRKEEQIPRYLNEAQVGEALEIAAGCGIYPEVAVALGTGLRVGEMIRLRWEDLDLERRMLYVRKSKSRRPRAIPLSGFVQGALEGQREITGALGWVFPARKTYTGTWKYVSRPRQMTWWQLAIRPLQKRLPPFRLLRPHAVGRGWHLFRHTFATRAAQAGVSLYKIAAWLGHRDIRTTEVYAHLATEFDPDIEAAAPRKSDLRHPSSMT